MQLFTNNADSSLNGAIAPGTTVLALKAGDGSKFPAPSNGDFFLVTLFQRIGTTELNHEIVKCTSRAGDNLTVVRAQEGTTARAFSTGDLVELRLTAGTLQALVVPSQATPYSDTSTATTAVPYGRYRLTASLNLTLPASPADGVWVDVVNTSGTTTARILRNAQNINGLAEDLTIDANYAAFRLVYRTGYGWFTV